MQKPSDRKEVGFSRERGSVVTISESLRVGWKAELQGWAWLLCSGKSRRRGLLYEGPPQRSQQLQQLLIFHRRRDQKRLFSAGVYTWEVTW